MAASHVISIVDNTTGETTQTRTNAAFSTTLTETSFQGVRVCAMQEEGTSGYTEHSVYLTQGYGNFGGAKDIFIGKLVNGKWIPEVSGRGPARVLDLPEELPLPEDSPTLEQDTQRPANVDDLRKIVESQIVLLAQKLPKKLTRNALHRALGKGFSPSAFQFWEIHGIGPKVRTDQHGSNVRYWYDKEEFMPWLREKLLENMKAKYRIRG